VGIRVKINQKKANIPIIPWNSPRANEIYALVVCHFRGNLFVPLMVRIAIVAVIAKHSRVKAPPYTIRGIPNTRWVV
jgi:hypothetical protein